MKIALLEPLGVEEAMIRELAAPIIARGHEFIYYPEKTADPEELARRSRGCEVVMIANNPYPEAAIREAEQLKMLDVAFTGVDHVCLDALKSRGVTVCNAANYSNQTVAELAVGLTIALLRKMPQGDAAARCGGTGQGLMGGEILGRTVGIVGTGRIGGITARLFQAFGARVIASSRTEKEEIRAMGIEYLPLEELLRQSDIVSLHVPNTPQTRGLIGREQLALMKPTALLINCARGPVVDSAALTDALNAGVIAGAGIDVFDREPPLGADEPLLHAKNCILTPHVGYYSREAMARRARIVFDNVLAYLDGRPQNVVKL